MTSSNRQKPARARVVLQADGMPFSLARVKPSATFSRKIILELLGDLKLTQQKAMRLTEEIVAILQEYLGELLTSERKASHAASLAALERISIESAKLSERLSSLSNEFLLAIEDHRNDSALNSDRPKFDIMQLARKLKHVSGAAARARTLFASRDRGAPRNERLDRAMIRFRKLFEGFDLIVDPRESGSKLQRRTLEGSGGILLVAVFEQFDAQTTESKLWGAWQRTAGSQSER